MQQHSQAVLSTQTEAHPHLAQVLAKHFAHPDQTPIAPYSQALWPQLLDFFAAHPGGVVLDLGCGTCMSTALLAERYPGCAVLGVDRSEVRLGLPDSARLPRNARCVRADQYDLLRLLCASKLRARAVYLLYPNPSPKAMHLKRRWHGHPIWPSLLGSCEVLELRTNWRIYADEFALALQFAGQQACVAPLGPTPPISRFEAKYQLSAHALWQVRCNLTEPLALAAPPSAAHAENSSF